MEDNSERYIGLRNEGWQLLIEALKIHTFGLKVIGISLCVFIIWMLIQLIIIQMPLGVFLIVPALILLSFAWTIYKIIAFNKKRNAWSKKLKDFKENVSAL